MIANPPRPVLILIRIHSSWNKFNQITYQYFVRDLARLNMQISATLGILKKPNSTLRQIFDDENQFLVSASIILVLASFLAVGTANEASLEENESFNQFGLLFEENLGKFALNSILDILANIVAIAILFLIGRQLGGTSNFKKAFCIFSYSLVPLMIGGAIATSLFFVVSFSSPDILLSDDTELGMEQFGYFGMVITYGIFFPFAFWSIVITIKAIKIANNFATTKSFGVFVLGAVLTYIVFIPRSFL